MRLPSRIHVFPEDSLLLIANFDMLSTLRDSDSSHCQHSSLKRDL